MTAVEAHIHQQTNLELLVFTTVEEADIGRLNRPATSRTVITITPASSYHQHYLMNQETSLQNGDRTMTGHNLADHGDPVELNLEDLEQVNGGTALGAFQNRKPSCEDHTPILYLIKLPLPSD